MKDKNGIEIIRENCKHKTPCNGCGLVERDCKVGDKHCQFTPSLKALEARIAELEDENANLDKLVSASLTTKKGKLRRHPNSNNGNNLDAETGSLDATPTQMEIEKWRDAFGGRTPEEAKRDFDRVIQELIDCKDGKRREAIEIVANHISQAEKMVDVRKLVKPLQWEYDEDDEIYSAPISPRCRKFLQVSVFCEKMKSGYWRVCTDCIVCDRKTPEEAKEAAQDWLVSLVANACGIEVRNG